MPETIQIFARTRVGLKNLIWINHQEDGSVSFGLNSRDMKFHFTKHQGIRFKITRISNGSSRTISEWIDPGPMLLPGGMGDHEYNTLVLITEPIGEILSTGNRSGNLEATKTEIIVHDEQLSKSVIFYIVVGDAPFGKEADIISKSNFLLKTVSQNFPFNVFYKFTTPQKADLSASIWT